MECENEILGKLKGGLIVSCQALETEPLHSSYIMGRMAYAAKLGGAVGIRANTAEDIAEIKKTTGLPVIGLHKQVYGGSDVYITPTLEEVDSLVACGAEIIAMDATNRKRPLDLTLDEFFCTVKKKYPRQLFMADCATFEEAVHAQEIGFDLVGTTLRGYTQETRGTEIPDFVFLKKLVANSAVPVVAEGGIWTPEHLKQAFCCGVFAAVVGTAITRPMEITKRFVKAIQS